MKNLFAIETCVSSGRAYPISEYKSRTKHGAAIMHMIMNNLDPRVAQFPEELVTYGGNGQVFSNWAQVDQSIVTGSVDFVFIRLWFVYLLF